MAMRVGRCCERQAGDDKLRSIEAQLAARSIDRRRPRSTARRRVAAHRASVNPETNGASAAGADRTRCVPRLQSRYCRQRSRTGRHVCIEHGWAGARRRRYEPASRFRDVRQRVRRRDGWRKEVLVIGGRSGGKYGWMSPRGCHRAPGDRESRRRDRGRPFLRGIEHARLLRRA